MGFLSGLGEFAGGVSKGISKEAEDHVRRVQAAAAEYELQQKQQTQAREDVLREQLANPQRVGLGGVDYAYNQDLAARKAAADAAAAQDQSGVLGKLAGIFSRHSLGRTGTAAGMDMPGTLVAQSPASPTPLGGQGSFAPTGDATPLAAAANGGVAVPKPPDLTRPMTEEERHLWNSRAYAKAGHNDLAMQEYDKAHQLQLGGTLRQIANATDDQLGEIGSKAFGQTLRVKSSTNPQGIKVYDVSRVDKDKDGKEVLTPLHTGQSLEELQADFVQNVDPEFTHRLVEAGRKHIADAAAAAATQKAQLATAGYTEAKTAETKVDTGTKQTAAQNAAELKVEQDWTVRPSAALEDGGRFDANTSKFELAGLPGATKKVQTWDEKAGQMVTKEVNSLKELGDETRKAWQANPWHNADLVQMRRFPDGRVTFAVKQPDGTWLQGYRDQNEATTAAMGAYKDPKAAAKAIDEHVKAAAAKNPAPAPGKSPTPTPAPAAAPAPTKPKTPAQSKHDAAQYYVDHHKAKYDEDVAFLKKFDARDKGAGTPGWLEMKAGFARERVKNFNQQAAILAAKTPAGAR